MTSPTSLDAAGSRERDPLRIRLDNGFQSGPLDGAWWPRSRDLEVELADLVDQFPHPAGGIERLLFSRPDWDAVPGVASVRRIQAEDGPVEVGSFPSDDTHVLVVVMRSGARLRLLVVPSDTEPALAARIMEQAADERNEQSPAELLGLSRPDQSEIGTSAWDDGGSSF